MLWLNIIINIHFIKQLIRFLYIVLLTGGGFFFWQHIKTTTTNLFLGFYYTTIELLILGNIE